MNYANEYQKFQKPRKNTISYSSPHILYSNLPYDPHAKLNAQFRRNLIYSHKSDITVFTPFSQLVASSRMPSESLQRKIDDAWRDMFELHSGQTITHTDEDAQAAEFTDKTEVPIILPPALEEAIRDIQDQDAVKMALKEFVLAWFWKGYYRGFQDGSLDRPCE